MNFNRLTEADINELKSIVSADRFSTGESNLDLHSRDESHHTPSRPEAVIWPINKEEVSKILKYANDHLIPIGCWGAGSSLEGNPIPLFGGVMLDFSQMNRILEIRPEDFQVDVEPGLIYQDLNEKLRHTGLFLPPDPGARASVGGMIANNASGIRCVRYGATRRHVLKLCVIMANGEEIEIGTRASKTSSAYDLVNLFVGSEGTLGVVVEATLHLTGYPAEFSAVIANFPSVEAAGQTVFELISSGVDPAALELVSSECIELINDKKGLGMNVSPTLFMEFSGATKNQLTEMLEIVQAICAENGCSDFRPGLGMDERNRLFEARHELGEMIKGNYPDRDNVVLDVAVPITAYPEMIEFVRNQLKKAGFPIYIYCHAGDGNLHCKLLRRTGNKEDYALSETVNYQIVSKALSKGGTATGEHGVGVGKIKFMEAEHGKSLGVMKKIKSVLDPNGILNPGKIFPQ